MALGENVDPEDNQPIADKVDEEFSWEEIHLIMKELNEVYEQSVKDDLDYVDNTLAIHDKLNLQWKEKERSNKDSIQTLMREIEDMDAKEQQNEDSSRAKNNTEQLEQLLDEKQQILKEIDDHENEHEHSSFSLTQLQNELHQIESEIEGVHVKRMTKTTSLHQLKYLCELYQSATGITWDYDQQDPYLLSGYLMNCTSKQVMPFQCQSSKMSSFAMANTLWDQIETLAAEESDIESESPVSVF